MKLKSFHIWDFPEEKVVVLLKDHKQFLVDCSKFFGSMRNLSKFLELPYYTISGWKYYNIYIPLWSLKKIIKKLKLNKKKIEKRIIAYKGISTSKPIKNPVLPISENSNLFVLMTHLICDGSVNKNGIPCYVNSNKSLINNMKSILNKTFGKFDIKEYLIRNKYYSLTIPKIISDLLIYYYDVEFASKKARLPKKIFKLPRSFIIPVVRAFVDDEGNVDLNYRIGIYSSNIHLLGDIRKLMCKLGFKCLSFIKKKPGGFYFYIKPKEIEQYVKLIGFNHSNKKRLLFKLIKNRKKGFKPGQHNLANKTTLYILDLLGRRDLISTKSLVLKLGVSKSNINVPLNKLKEQNLIEEKYRKGQTVYYGLKEE